MPFKFVSEQRMTTAQSPGSVDTFVGGAIMDITGNTLLYAAIAQSSVDARVYSFNGSPSANNYLNLRSTRSFFQTEHSSIPCPMTFPNHLGDTRGLRLWIWDYPDDAASLDGTVLYTVRHVHRDDLDLDPTVIKLAKPTGITHVGRDRIVGFCFGANSSTGSLIAVWTRSAGTGNADRLNKILVWPRDGLTDTAPTVHDLTLTDEFVGIVPYQNRYFLLYADGIRVLDASFQHLATEDFVLPDRDSAPLSRKDIVGGGFLRIANIGNIRQLPQVVLFHKNRYVSRWTYRVPTAPAPSISSTAVFSKSVNEKVTDTIDLGALFTGFTSITVSGLPVWATFDSDTNMISFTAPDVDGDTHFQFMVTATNTVGSLSASTGSQIFTIIVADLDPPPTVPELPGTPGADAGWVVRSQVDLPAAFTQRLVFQSCVAATHNRVAMISSALPQNNVYSDFKIHLFDFMGVEQRTISLPNLSKTFYPAGLVIVGNLIHLVIYQHNTPPRSDRSFIYTYDLMTGTLLYSRGLGNLQFTGITYDPSTRIFYIGRFTSTRTTRQADVPGLSKTSGLETHPQSHAFRAYSFDTQNGAWHFHRGGAAHGFDFGIYQTELLVLGYEIVGSHPHTDTHSGIVHRSLKTNMIVAEEAAPVGRLPVTPSNYVGFSAIPGSADQQFVFATVRQLLFTTYHTTRDISTPVIPPMPDPPTPDPVIPIERSTIQLDIENATDTTLQPPTDYAFAGNGVAVDSQRIIVAGQHDTTDAWALLLYNREGVYQSLITLQGTAEIRGLEILREGGILYEGRLLVLRGSQTSTAGPSIEIWNLATSILQYSQELARFTAHGNTITYTEASQGGNQYSLGAAVWISGENPDTTEPDFAQKHFIADGALVASPNNFLFQYTQEFGFTHYLDTPRNAYLTFAQFPTSSQDATIARQSLVLYTDEHDTTSEQQEDIEFNRIWNITSSDPTDDLPDPFTFKGMARDGSDVFIFFQSGTAFGVRKVSPPVPDPEEETEEMPMQPRPNVATGSQALPYLKQIALPVPPGVTIPQGAFTADAMYIYAVGVGATSTHLMRFNADGTLDNAQFIAIPHDLTVNYGAAAEYRGVQKDGNTFYFLASTQGARPNGFILPYQADGTALTVIRLSHLYSGQLPIPFEVFFESLVWDAGFEIIGLGNLFGAERVSTNVHTYAPDGELTSLFPTTLPVEETSPVGAAKAGNRRYIVHSTPPFVFGHDNNYGVIPNLHFSLHADNQNPKAAAWNGSALLVLDGTTVFFYGTEPIVIPPSEFGKQYQQLEGFDELFAIATVSGGNLADVKGFALPGLRETVSRTVDVASSVDLETQLNKVEITLQTPLDTVAVGDVIFIHSGDTTTAPTDFPTSDIYDIQGIAAVAGGKRQRLICEERSA